MASNWKLLRHVSSNTSLPALLVKSEFRSSSYKILLTDLTHVWIEEIKQRPLIQRAWEIDSDIDPVDIDQRQMLLRHIQDALDGRNDTKIALSKDHDPQAINLTAYCPLPIPLKPLKWPMHFTASAPSSLTNELLLPTLAEHSVARDQIHSLLSSLNDKDHVINKLVDKMQAEGIELGKVFPSAGSSKSARRSGSREDVGKSVKGLALFNETQWRTQFAYSHEVPGTYQDLLPRLFAPESNHVAVGINEQLEHGRWWERLNEEPDVKVLPTEDPSQGQVQSTIKKEPQVNPTPSVCSSPTKERQSSLEQIALPQRSNPQYSSPKTLNADSTTDTSDDELDVKQPSPQTKGESSKLVKSSSSSSSSNSPAPAREASMLESPKSKTVLGRIGGVSKANTSPSKPKLGQVGGVVKPIPTQSEASTLRATELPKRSKSPILTRESSPERANRKREELKRDLEDKGKIGVKKRRKF
ncbi:MAG: hypothetical protein Q9182_000268 [Xanthomendoza sp. 2 TL-2023]